MLEYDKLSSEEKEGLATDISNRAISYGKNRDGLILKAHVTRAQNHKYWSKAEKESVDVKITFMELLRSGLLCVFAFTLTTIALYFKQWYISYCLIAFALVLSFVFYRYYNYKVRISWQGIDIRNEFIGWESIIDCYIVEHQTRNHNHIDLLIFPLDGKMRVFDVEGVDPTLLGHYIFHYLQHYRATSVQPS